MKDEIKINEEEIEKYCNEHNNMIYYSVSAKNDENVEEAFNKVAELAYNRNNNKNKEEELPKIKTIKVKDIKSIPDNGSSCFC